MNKKQSASKPDNNNTQLTPNGNKHPGVEDDTSSCGSSRLALPPANLSDLDSEMPLSQITDSAHGATELFTESVEAATHLQDPDF